MADQAGASERQIQVRFTTKQTKYAVTDTPIAVPISLRRYALSEIVNHLLGNGMLNNQLFANRVALAPVTPRANG
jgi:hypothetical protein